MEPRLSFEAVAQFYERARPGDPAALIDQVVAVRDRALLLLAQRDARGATLAAPGGCSMQLAEADRLLEPGYLELESGWQRLEDGQLHVAAWTTMFGCKGRMVEWWFGYLETTEQYKWWHPRDHVWCEWKGERGTGRFIGGTHHVHEYIGGELQKLKVQFREPGELLDASRLEAAGITAAICARVGPLEAPVWAGHLIHLCRDTDYGCEMRSRFWLGDLEPPELVPTREARIGLFPDRAGEGLLRHCHEEMSYLAGFLPDLYAREVGARQVDAEQVDANKTGSAPA